ncbi:hypothetical protein C8Q78DRAFT_1044317 [Trametes maxima]|nr:hypothetical protein C8Q78DRAFT_1044317 [Trametes maxima]
MTAVVPTTAPSLLAASNTLKIFPSPAFACNSGLAPGHIQPIEALPVSLSPVEPRNAPPSPASSHLHLGRVCSRPVDPCFVSPIFRGVPPVGANQPPPPPLAVDLLFPAEIWLRIFDHALVHDQKSVLQASTLCSGIRWAAEEALYRFPEVLERSAARAFASAILASPSRAQAVTGLSVGCRDKDVKEYIQTVRSILPKLERLCTLHLANLGTCCVDVFTSSSLLTGLSLSSLRRIRGQPLYLSPKLIAILSKFSRLEEIRVYDYTSVPPPPSEYTWTDEEEDDAVPEEFEEIDAAIEGSENEKQDGRVEILAGLPNLRALACPGRLIKDMHIAGRVTSLCITKVTRSMMAHVASLFGEQLISLRVERTLGRYRGLAYPTTWTWTEFTRLKFLDVQDIGVRRVYHDDKVKEVYTVKEETLPPSLKTLVWGAAWVMDCALLDGQSEAWRRNEIRRFSEDTLRRFSPTLRTVMYRWGKKSYQCELAGDRFSEGVLGIPGLAGDDAWAEAR